MRIDLGDDEVPEIGLIALIDCIFFLLMFFMAATSFKQQNVQRQTKDIPIVLPTASATLTAGDVAKAPLVIGIDARGGLYVDNARTTLQALHDRLRDEAARSPGRPVRIDGDRRTPYQHIVHVLDLCQFAGLTQVSMHTRP
ncbi:MAG: biopolymer transporter ExbD [Rubrivivax sp.]|jgi:biopolymer transport protein ExbD|nr:biopolymer transporter ExbD [Rubrivivax sp.]